MTVAILLLMAAIVVAVFFVPFRKQEAVGHPEQGAVDRRTSVATVEARNGGRSDAFCRELFPCAVECANVTQGEPGALAAEFVRTNQVGCDEVKWLIFSNCVFPDATLRRGWLPLDRTLRKLTLTRGNLAHIEEAAFADLVFVDPDSQVATLELDRLRVAALSAGTFRDVDGVQALRISANALLRRVDADVLCPLAATLSSFAFTESTSSTTLEMVANFTDHGTLPSLLILDLRFNPALLDLSRDVLRGTPRLRSLYFSSLRSVDVAALRSVASTLQLLHLADNLLESLEEGTLDGMLDLSGPKDRFHMKLAGNPWRCDCALEWLQSLMRAHPNVTEDVPLCGSCPYQPIVEADLCDSQGSTTLGTTTLGTTEETTLQTTMTTIPTETTTPSTLPTEATTGTSSTTTSLPTETTIPTEATTVSTLPTEATTSPPTTTSHVIPTETTTTFTTSTTTIPTETTSTMTSWPSVTSTPAPDVVRVHCPDFVNDSTGGRFTRSLLAVDLVFPASQEFVVHEEGDGSVLVQLGAWRGLLLMVDHGDITDTRNKCWANATGNVVYHDVNPSSTYTLCLLVNDSVSSPYNCRALTTRPEPGKRPWLLIQDKKIVLGVGITIALACGLTCALAVFLLVRRHPHWLRGSERVVVVKHRSADVLVLPSSPSSSTGTMEAPDSARPSKTSYISAVEPTSDQLKQWRRSATASLPPLPPPRRGDGRSASPTSWMPHDGQYTCVTELFEEATC